MTDISSPPSRYTGPVFFVGGAPRSGTTVTHALLCSSARVNAYHPEVSFITPMIRAYTVGQSAWDGHTQAFFAEPEHFKTHMRGLIDQSLSHVHRALNSPELLSVKDPLMTPYFPKVLDLFGARARFVTVIRNPYDVVRSRQEVARKANQPFSPELARGICQQYLQSYRHIDNPAFGDQLIYFRYEDLLQPEVLSQLRGFTGCADISPDNVWRERRSETGAKQSSNPWHSPKYHGAIDLSSRLSPLEAPYREIVEAICAPLMERFAYTEVVAA